MSVAQLDKEMMAVGLIPVRRIETPPLHSSRFPESPLPRTVGILRYSLKLLFITGFGWLKIGSEDGLLDELAQGVDQEPNAAPLAQI